jgi:hypothetical protein
MEDSEKRSKARKLIAKSRMIVGEKRKGVKQIMKEARKG